MYRDESYYLRLERDRLADELNQLRYQQEQEHQERQRQRKEHLAHLALQPLDWPEAFQKQKSLISKELKAFPEPDPYDGSTWFTDWLKEIEKIEQIWREEEVRSQAEREKLEQEMRLRILRRIQDETEDSPSKEELIESIKANDTEHWLSW